MVDMDELDSMKDGDDSESNKSSSSSSSKSKSSSGGSKSSNPPSTGSSSGTYELDEDELVKPDNKTVSDVSKEWASDKGELNDGAHQGENLKSYMSRQVREVEELHENIREMASNNNENFDEFTLYMHAMFLNFGQNRVGIAQTIENQFGKDRREAVELANKICQKAGEPEFMENMVQDMTENLADL